jgi:hypothetical protein
MFRRVAAVLFVGAIVLAACGGDDADEPASDTPEAVVASTTLPGSTEELVEDVTEQAEEKGEELIAGATPGTFAVDGQQFESQTVRCEPFDFYGDASDDDLDLGSISEGSTYVNVTLTHSEGFGQEGGTYPQQHLSVFFSRQGDGGTEQFEGVATNDAEGNWYPGGALVLFGDQTEEPLPAKPFEQDGNRISGSLSLEQNWPEGATGTVEVSFDLAYTDEIQDCSL